MAKIFAILNFKGGCAKTTTAINLGAALQILDKKVLIVDLDFQCNATSNLGFKPAMGNTIYELLTQKGIEEMPIYEFKKGLDYIPSSKEMKNINNILVNKNNREYILRRLLNLATTLYDYILIDCPPNGGLLNKNAMAAAESLLIPVECEAYSVQGVGTILDELKEVKEDEVNANLNILGFLLTRYDSSLSIHKGIASELRSKFKDQVFNTKIRKNTALSKASAAHQTIYDYDKTSYGAEDYMQLAREITGIKPKNKTK